MSQKKKKNIEAGQEKRCSYKKKECIVEGRGRYDHAHTRKLNGTDRLINQHSDI